MAVIPASQARARFTQKLIDLYIERPRVFSFLRSFFPEVYEPTRYLNIEVVRGSEKVAVNVARGSIGNRNQFAKSTEHVLDPPLYREYFDITELDLYDRMIGSGMVDESIVESVLNSALGKLATLQDKIERAMELQCSQALHTGIVTLEGYTVDYDREADSMIDLGSGNYWNQSSTDPLEDLVTGAQFLRKVGKVQGGTFNLIFGANVLSAFRNNTAVKDVADIRKFDLLELRAPQQQSTGFTTHGEVSFGDYKGRIIGYPEYYDNTAGESTPYIDPNTVIMLPDNPRFKMGFGACPQLVDESNPTIKKGWMVGEYTDDRKKTKEYDIQACPLAVLTARDQVWTAQVLASGDES